MPSLSYFIVFFALFAFAYTAVIPKPPRYITTPKAVTGQETSGEYYSEEPVVTTEDEDEVKYTTSKNYKPNEYEKEQNRNARYSFSTNIDDKISDLTHQRSETREGVNVEGEYSYSDGYHRRTVHYVADEKGFRIVNEEIEELSEDGPTVDLTGTASVDTQVHGTKTAYKIQSVPVEGPVGKIVGEKPVAKIVSEEPVGKIVSEKQSVKKQQQEFYEE